MQQSTRTRSYIIIESVIRLHYSVSFRRITADARSVRAAAGAAAGDASVRNQ